MSANINKEIEIIINRFKIGDYDFVINKSKVLLKKIPNNDLVWNIRGLSLQTIGNIKESIDCFQKSININPKNIAAKNNLGNSYKYANQYKLALDCFEYCIREDPKYTASIVNLANLKVILNDYEEAIMLYNNVLEENENIESIYVNLAQAYQSTKQFKKALIIIEKGLKKFPEQTKIDKLLSIQINYSKEENHLEKMLYKLKKNNLNDEQKINLYFALGKAFEDKKNYKDSFKYYLKGNELKREKLKFNIEDKRKLFNDIKKYFSKNTGEGKNISKNNKNVIFIFGLPRSGTTLIENIISSHHKVSGLGEINYLNKFFNLNFIKNDQLNIDFIEDFLSIDLQKHYFDFIKLFKINEDFITDKSLNIYWYLGFINMFFPKAKFIHCQREAKDNCLSIFKNLFEDGQGWKYNESELIDYYNLYKEIMVFWNKFLDQKILNIQYESLIKDNVKNTKNLINFCGLEWDENCLNHHQNNMPIKTLSLNQANKPIYSSSINSAENFKPYLKEIFSKFN